MADQKRAYMVAFFGFPGCLPDSDCGPIECRTRREMVEFVDSVLDQYEYSGRARRQVNLAAVWRLVQICGLPGNGFTIENTQPGRLDRIEFRFLTREEFEQWQGEFA